MKKYAFVLLSIGIVVLSCQKDDDKPGASKTQLITSATWKYDTVAIDGDKNGTPDTKIPSDYLDDVICSLDNTITLKSDGTGTVDEGRTKCATTDPQSFNITWAFKENETVLSSPNALFGGTSGDAKILILTDAKLRLSRELTIQGYPLPITIVLDLKH